MHRVKFGPIEVGFEGDVLEPRPWTLLQAEWAGELATAVPEGPLLELCAGVGHIGQVAAVLTGREVVQVDVNAAAVAQAQRNAEVNGLGARVEVRCGDLADAVGADERYPLVLADPPYLTSDEVGDDPVLAVDGGAGGLAIHRRCLVVAAGHLVAGGAVLLQARGRAQVAELESDVAAAGFVVVEVREADEERAVALLRWA